MDKNKQASYDEVHAKLVEAMQKASCSDETGPYKTPSVDLSFLEEDSETESKRRKFSFGRFGKVAAILIIALLSINVLMIATNSMTSYGEKGLLHRIQVGINGIFTDEEETVSDDVESSFMITDMDEIHLAKEFLPDLYVPEYIPKEYELQSLEIEKYKSGDYCGEYLYCGNGDELKISFSVVKDSQGWLYSHDEAKIIKLEDRMVCIYQEKKNNRYIADVYVETGTINISGKISKTEIEKIAYKMQNKVPL